MTRILVVGLVFVAGAITFSASPGTRAQPAKLSNVWDKYLYPLRQDSAPGTDSPNLHLLLISTTDDFDQVITWYAKVTDASLGKSKPGSILTAGNRISVQDLSTASTSTRILVQHEKTFSLTLVVTRAKDEKLTQIAMSYLKK